MTASRDKVSATLDTHRRGSRWACNCGFALDEDMPYITHQSHLVDELVKATASEQVTTEAELDALPDRTIVRSAAGTVANLVGPRAYFFGYEAAVSRRLLELPVTILQHGAVTV